MLSLIPFQPFRNAFSKLLRKKEAVLMRCLIFHGSSRVCSFSDHDVARILHYEVKEEIKKKGNESPQFVTTDIAVYLETCEINLV